MESGEIVGHDEPLESSKSDSRKIRSVASG
jgi:hypothetical protein